MNDENGIPAPSSLYHGSVSFTEADGIRPSLLGGAGEAGE
jgi:hypothetical protein